MQNRKTLTICINMGSVSAGLSDKFLLNLIKFFRFLGGQHAPEYPVKLVLLWLGESKEILNRFCRGAV